MTPEEQEHMTKLCQQIEVEEDHEKFLQLVQEHNDLLDGKAHRLEHQPSALNSQNR